MSSCDIDALFGLDESGEVKAEQTVAHSAASTSNNAATSSDDEVEQLFGVQNAPPAANDAASSSSLAPVKTEPSSSHKRKRAMPTLLSAADAAAAASHAAAATSSLATAASASTRPTKLSTAEAERLHAASVRAAALSRRAASISAAASPAPPPVPYKSLLSNRDIIFNAPILSGDSPFSSSAATPPVFVNAPSSFSTNSHFATGNSTAFPMMPASAEELADMLRQRDDVPAKEAEAFEAAIAAAAASGSSPLWPISMRGKSIATVSASNAVKSKLAHRAALERDQEFKASSESMPIDSHVHGPGISDHSTPKAHYDGYWAQRVAKLELQRANPQIYDVLPAFQTDERKQEEEQRKRRKQERQADAARPDDVPFTLAQTTQSTTAAVAASSSSTQAASSLPSRSLSTVSGASSTATTSSSRPRVAPNQLFAGVCAYINGDTETRVAGIDLGSLTQGADSPEASAATPASASELSCFHLGKLVQLGGGRVLPYASRTQLTHYVVDHLSYSKARSEMHALMGGGKAVSGAAARHIHIVRPEWIRACRQAGRRVSEEPYSVLRDSQHVNLSERWKS